MTGPDTLHLGAVLDPETGARTAAAVRLRPEDLTTHGVIVGMTGSGKTGLGVVLLEEVLRSGRPALILDPKGDLANLALLFPELAPADFRPWVDEAEARREGLGEDALAARTAERWRGGLADWSLGGEDIRALRDSMSLRVYTPGSTAGAPLDLIGSLDPPDGADEEGRLDAAEGLVSGLLTLAGLTVDPLTSPEHILLANLVDHAWRSGRSLTLASLIAGVQSPPFRKLGVFEVDAFVPPAARTKLALRLNGLVASPTFTAWRTGDPLNIGTLLRAPDGRPRASVVQLSHLSEAERMFVVTLLLSRAVAWMRGQPGTSDLRALIYVDELFGFAPPTARPPSKKPLLTLFKQARAHGLGVVVATQNPVDVDYKLMSNAGTWMVGRLTTERDKARVLEALRSADGSVDVSAWDARIGGLGKRQFLMKQAGSPEPVPFTTRWAMAYLRGPITRAELALLPGEVTAARAGDEGVVTGVDGEAARTSAAEAARMKGGGAEVAGQAKTAGGAEIAGGARAEAGVETGGGSDERAGALADDETPVPPVVADDVPERWLDPAAPWAADLGVAPGAGRLEAGLAARVRLLWDDARTGLRHEEEWEAVAFPLDEDFRPDDVRAVDYDARDFVSEPSVGGRYVLPRAPIDQTSFFRDGRSALVDHLYRGHTVKLLHNIPLKLYSRLDESVEAFKDRCLAAAEDRADAEAAKLRDRYEKRIGREREQATRAEQRVRELEVDVSARRQQEMVSGAGELLGMFMSGRRRTSSLSRMASRRSQSRRTAERLRTAEERLASETADVERIEDELATELDDIWERWQEAVWQVEQVEVSLKKKDIAVEEVLLFWARQSNPDA